MTIVRSDELPEAEHLRRLVPVMRELGVLQAFGVILGPPPPKAVALEIKAAAEPDNAEVRQELAEELRRAKLYDLREGIRLDLAATRPDMSDEECDELIGPERIAALGM